MLQRPPRRRLSSNAVGFAVRIGGPFKVYKQLRPRMQEPLLGLEHVVKKDAGGVLE
jgi:hypothetical protein